MIPNFLIELIVAKTSSETSKFVAVETPEAKDENNIHLMLILLSPLTEIVLLNFLILFSTTNVFGSYN